MLSLDRLYRRWRVSRWLNAWPLAVKFWNTKTSNRRLNIERFLIYHGADTVFDSSKGDIDNIPRLGATTATIPNHRIVLIPSRLSAHPFFSTTKKTPVSHHPLALYLQSSCLSKSSQHQPDKVKILTYHLYENPISAESSSRIAVNLHLHTLSPSDP